MSPRFSNCLFFHAKGLDYNVEIKPASDHDPKVIDGVFKGFVHRAITICSENHIESELQFLVDTFVENGYTKTHLLKLIKQVRDKFNTMSNNDVPNENHAQTISLPWVPGLSPKLRKIYRNAGYKVVFKSSANLKTILTSRNKSQLPPHSHPGVYLHESTCSLKYIGQTKKQVSTRMAEHMDNISKKRNDQPMAQHVCTCGCSIDWTKVRTLKVSNNKFEREVREALEIQYHQCGPRMGGMNLDDGRYLKTSFWTPMFKSLRENDNSETSSN